MNDAARLQGLDGLRGIAILLVVVYHLWIKLSGQDVLPSGSPWTFLYAGNTGVSLFFVLSGFLVSLPFIKAFERGQLSSIWLYALNRALRISPPYYFVGLIGIALTGQFQQLIPMLFFTAGGYDVGYFSAVWWSLSTEVQFYLLLPIVFIAAHNGLRVPLLALLGILLITVHMLVIFKVISPILPFAESFELKFRLILSVIGQLPTFAMGLGLAILYFRKPSRRIPHIPSNLGILALVLLLAWALLPAARHGALPFMWSNPEHVLLQAMLWGGIVWLILNRQPPSVSALDNWITRYFGRISFSLYLVHMPVLELVLKHFRTSELSVDFAIAFTLSVAVAQLCYWLVERPSLAFKNKLPQPNLPSGITV
jgi:peptidoglycan/LPS O-acetylase OafA/YrhL